MVIMSWTWMETGLLITVKKMAKVDSTYPVKITPELSDRVWGFDPTSLKNTLFSIPGILDLNNSDIEPNAINVKRYPGVVGDGINDDTVGLQLALDEAAGRWVHFPPGDYFITDPLVLPENTRIKAYGARVFNHESHFYLIEANSNTIIKGMELEGAGSETPDDEGRGINFVGTVGAYKSGLLIEDCYIHDIGFYGTYCRFAKNISIKGTRVINIGYTGMIFLSVSEAHGLFNHVKGITGVNGEGYNVGFTRGSTSVGDNLADNPRSVNCSFSWSLIEDNILWKGLDTHCGDSITFDNNIVRNCAVPIGIVPGNTPFAPKNCKVTNNTLHSGLGLNAGVLLSGVFNPDDMENSLEYAENCHIIGNTLIECGITANAFSGGVRIRDTKNTVISGNHFIMSKVTDIGVQNSNYNFTIFGNTFENVNAPSGLLSYGVHVTNPFNTGIIGGNTFERNNPSLNVNVCDRTIRLNPSHIDNIRVTLLGDQNNGFLSEAVEDGPFVTKTFTSKGGLIKGLVNISVTPSGSSQMLGFNHGYGIWADNVGIPAGSGGNDTRSYFSGPNGGALYLAARSGTLARIFLQATQTVVTGRLQVLFSNILEVHGDPVNFTGAGGTANEMKEGFWYYPISNGLSNNHPEDQMTVLNIKRDNNRTFQIGVGALGRTYIRSLHGSDNNTWHRIQKTIGEPQTITTSGILNNLVIFPTTDHLILTAATAVNGIIAGIEGRELIIENRNTVSIEFTADSGSSDAANRTAYSFTLLAGEMIKTKYTNTKWRRVN